MQVNFKANWNLLGEDFETADPVATLQHACTYLMERGDIVFLTAFGPEGCAVMKMIHDLVQADILPKDRIIQSYDELLDYDAHKIYLEEKHQESELDAHNDDISQQSFDNPDQDIITKTQVEVFNRDPGKFIIANLDTGYQFKETLELKEQLESKYNLPIIMIHPDLSVKEQDEKHGKDLFKTDPDQCCYMRKLLPLSNLLDKRLAWITSIRRDQSPHRANAKAFEFDQKFKLGKINPLIRWTKSDTWKYIHENKIPYNPLLDKGYDSIGCEPCTQPGEGRKGRWAGQDKIECGLHLQDSDMNQGGEFVI